MHGAWADSGSWNAVTGLLQRAGYTVYAPPNPLEGLAIDTATLADFLHTITGPIVLVGHSYGGEVITNAATGDSQVKALVYDDAYLPKQGEDLTDLTTAGSCFAVQDLSTVFTFVPDPVSPSGAVAYVKPAVFPGCFANGLPASVGAVLAATQRPLATSTFTDQSGVPAWQTIPSWAVVGTADHIITPAEQLFMAQPGTRPHHRDQRPPPVNDHRPGGRGQRHHPGGPGHQLTTAHHRRSKERFHAHLPVLGGRRHADEHHRRPDTQDRKGSGR